MQICSFNDLISLCMLMGVNLQLKKRDFSEKKQVHNGDYIVVTPLVVVEIQAAKE